MRSRTGHAVRWGTATAVLVVAAALPPLSATGTTTTSASPASTAAPTAARTVTLPSGDRLTVRTDPSGRLLVSPVRAGTPMTVRQVGGEAYAFPLSAQRRPGFDPAGYDVSALLRGETAAPPPAAQPDFPMRTVTVNAVDELGNPVPSAILSVFNDDDIHKYDRGISLLNGLAKVSVPDGHYSAEIDVPTFDATGQLSTDRAVFAEFTVDGGPAAVTLDARTATHTASVTTPKPATLAGQDYFWFRGPDEQTGQPFDWNLPPGVTFYYSDNDPGTVGVQHFYVHDRFDSPAGNAKPYTYDVEFTTDGALTGDQHHRVRDADLAVLDTRYYSATAQTGSILRFGYLPWEEIQYRQPYPVTEPLARTEYLTGNLGQIYQTYLNTTGGPSGEDWASGLHHYQAGQHATVDWRRGPLVPGMPANTSDGTGSGDGNYYHCPACREGDTLSLLVSPLTDSEPDHAGAPPGGTTVSSRYQLFQGDTPLADLSDTGGADVTVGPDAASYRLVYDQSGGGPAAHTEWTFQSQHSGATTVPGYWLCGANAKVNLTDCSPVSLLTVHYQLAQRLDGTIGSGPQAMTLTIGHASGAPAVAVDTPSVAVSYDQGTTWSPAAVAPCGNGAFQVRWAGAGNAGSTLSLRVTASDTAGTTVTQTVTDAAAITS